MTSLQNYLVPWIISQVFSIVLLFIAWKKPVWARYIFSVMFLAAGTFNWFTVTNTPEAYQMYAETAIGFYRDFINGWFRDHVLLAVGAIATGQLLIGAGMMAGRRWLAFSCLVIIIFLIAIAPLGVGSAFPFSITVSIAVFLVYRYYRRVNTV